MLQMFAQLVNDLDQQKPKIPMAYTTSADLKKCERIDAAIGWAVATDAFLARCERRAAYARSDCHRRDLLQRRSDERQAALADEAEAPGYYLDPAHRPNVLGPRLGHGDYRLSRVVVRDATNGHVKRVGRIDWEHGSTEVPLTPFGGAVDARNAPPRYAESFPKSAAFAQQPSVNDWQGLAQLPNWTPLPEALEPLISPEEDVANYEDLRSKETIAAEEPAIFDYTPDDGCPRCRRGPALCTCPLEPEEQEPYLAGDPVDTLIRLEGELVEFGNLLMAADGEIAWQSRLIPALERNRRKPGTPEEQMRLKRIARATARIEQAERTIRDLTFRHQRTLEALWALETMGEAQERAA